MTDPNNETRARRPRSVPQLAREVFREVEADQGRGFISDGLEVIQDRDRFFNTVRYHLKHSEAAVAKIKAFLKKHGEL